MLTITCTIKFKDGKTLTARGTAATPYDDAAIEYFGDVGKYPRRLSRTGIMVMRYLMQRLAEEAGAEFTDQFEGAFIANE